MKNKIKRYGILDLATAGLGLLHDIRLPTKFLRFFQKFYFYFLASTVQLAFSYICTTTIYGLSPTLWQRQDPEFVEVLRLLTKESWRYPFSRRSRRRTFSHANDEKENEINGSPLEPSQENKVDEKW